MLQPLPAPLLRLTVLLVAAAQGQGRVQREAPDEDGAPAAPRLAPRYDFSRYFGSDPGGGLGAGLGGRAKAAASEQQEDGGEGFVDAVDFKSFFGGSGFGGQQKKQPFFGASAQSGSRLPFGSFGAVAAASSDEQDDFSELAKAKRGVGGGPAGASGRTRDGADEDFFHFDFPEGGGDKAADLHDEDAEDKDEADDDDRSPGFSAGAAHTRTQPLKQAGNSRYPSYSSYYHTQPEQLRAAGGVQDHDALEQDDEFGFDEDERGDVREPSRGSGSGSTSTASAEAYDSRPFQDARGAGSSKLGGLSSGSSGPARFNLQGGFVPSPVDPLRTQATQAAHSSKAASHAAVHAAVKAAHRAAASHGKPGAGAGAALSLGAADGGLGSRSPYVRRTREEPDDAFFESFTDGDDREDREADDYKFSPEHFEEEDDGNAQQATEAEGDDEGGQSAAASAGRCKKVVKKGAVCTVCADPKTGGNYEQCQYATEPETQSYSFGRSSSYGNPRPKSRRRRRREEGRQQQDSSQDTSQDSSQDTSQDAQDVQQQETAQQKDAGAEGNIDAFGEALKDSHEKDHEQIEKELDSSLEQLQGPKYEDYFSFLFPELSKEKSQEKSKDDKKKKSKNKKNSKKAKKKKADEEQDSEEVSSLLSRLEDDGDPFTAETTSGLSGSGPGTGASEDLWLGPPESLGPPGKGLQGVGVVPKKDLERMLGEFQQKDRSDCTKVEKDKMTCYQCVDKKGMQHEECMFVAASEPKQRHLAYHQSSAFKAPGPPPAPKGKSAALTASTTAAPGRAASAAPTQRAAASNAAPKSAPTPTPSTTSTKSGAKSRQQRAAEQAKEEPAEEGDDGEDDKEDLQEVDDEGDDDPEGPQGLGQGPDDGMFTEETKPVFDRALRMSLPKYMLERSEHERVFDETLAAGV
ncbi:uncharacterized protein LOC113212660 [Frankliniella occidentalis]|uniref:Uncharacterized protein LOC113212660 n=1 Tax=Frankliniella occidentalis TaxID=133901 RepID=A0A9C6U8N4_FRAOC|nr:uncharacterized protein LOC113212660 [Frankliniella occidentalis]